MLTALLGVLALASVAREQMTKMPRPRQATASGALQIAAKPSGWCRCLGSAPAAGITVQEDERPGEEAAPATAVVAPTVATAGAMTGWRPTATSESMPLQAVAFWRGR